MHWWWFALLGAVYALFGRELVAVVADGWNGDLSGRMRAWFEVATGQVAVD